MRAWWPTRLSVAVAVGVCLFAQACDSSSNSTAEPSKVNTQTSSVIETGVCHDDQEHPENLLTCDKITQPLYWLGKRFSLPGLPDVVLSSSYTLWDEQPITPKTHVFLRYAVEGTRIRNGFDLYEWYRPAWNDYVAQFTGYDASTVPEGGPVNWWQHPCVEEETYQAGNGAEVHLFRAHLDSLLTILPMSPAEISTCLSKPVQIVNAHVYFKDTVIQLEAAREAGEQYGSEETVRFIAESLRPYEAQD